MGKKSTQSSMKISKNDKKLQHPPNRLIKNLRPKVYIIDSSNFKNLVQELTGNSPVVSSPPPPFVSTSPPPVEEVPAIVAVEDHAYQENSLELSFDFSTPSQGSPDSSLNYLLESSQNMDFSSQYGDIESLLMEMDQISYTCDDAMIQQEICVYDYDFSGLI
ncbi:vq domain-containing protein [Abeliophyllum distichum]|uniref:Vq domain-containing protein n=1 Tax=Abeliophyllum distichum TaxID=126358 RepID=A0ABD1QK34_9LAMI